MAKFFFFFHSKASLWRHWASLSSECKWRKSYERPKTSFSRLEFFTKPQEFNLEFNSTSCCQFVEVHLREKLFSTSQPEKPPIIVLLNFSIVDKAFNEKVFHVHLKDLFTYQQYRRYTEEIAENTLLGIQINEIEYVREEIDYI